MHGDVVQPGGRHHPIHLWVGEPSRNIIDDADPGIRCEHRRAGIHGVNTDRDSARNDRADHGKHALQLLLHGDALGPWPRRLATDINDVGTLLVKLDRVRNRAGDAVVQSTITKRIRGHIQDAHNARAIFSTGERMGHPRPRGRNNRESGSSHCSRDQSAP